MASTRTLLRFALVGAAVAALYLLLYAGFLAFGVAQLLANALAFLTAVAVQYLGQAGVTFDAPWRDGAQAGRFGVMIGLGLATSTIITGIIGPSLGLSTPAAAIAVTLVLPVQNFLIMSRWVFARRHDPSEKHS